MIPANIPDDINVELLFSHFPMGACKASFKGLHKRNAYSDIIDIEENADSTLHISIGRNSLYNALPECMFHSIDRFNELPKLEEKERFAQEYESQEQEKKNAYQFFEPIDLFLFWLRISAREQLIQYSEHNKVLIDILADQLSPEQRDNRFIKQILPLLPSCKYIRGNKTLLTLMLRKVFIEENIKIESHKLQTEFCDKRPRYDYALGANLDSLYVGNVFDENVTVYDIHYWSEEDCDGHFLEFVADVEQLRGFLQDFFMSVDEIISFNIWNDDEPLRLGDEIFYNYLNYNTNI